MNWLSFSPFLSMIGPARWKIDLQIRTNYSWHIKSSSILNQLHPKPPLQILFGGELHNPHEFGAGSNIEVGAVRGWRNAVLWWVVEGLELDQYPGNFCSHMHQSFVIFYVTNILLKAIWCYNNLTIGFSALSGYASLAIYMDQNKLYSRAMSLWVF